MKKFIEEIDVYKPFVKHNVKLDGIALSSQIAGEKANIGQKIWITSFDSNFEFIAGGLVNGFCGQNKGEAINHMLVRIRGEEALVFSKFPLSMEITSNGKTEIGQLIFKNQILNISKIKFEDSISLLDYQPTDKLVYLFRNGFYFGLYCNFIKKDNIDTIGAEIARIYRHLYFYKVYESIKNAEVFNRMQQDGWFPFIALIRFDKYRQLLENYVSNNKSSMAVVKEYFTKEILYSLADSWFLHEELKDKKALMEAGLNQYLQHTKEGYIASIKILITEIEGILRKKYKGTIKNMNIKNLLEELHKSAEKKYHVDDALVLPKDFIYYIKTSVYGPFTEDNIPDNRNSVAHGVAESEQYSCTRALQVILTLDHLVCFL